MSGRVDPATFDPEWIATRREIDPVRLLEPSLTARDIIGALRGLSPVEPGYGRLVKALARFRAAQAAGGTDYRARTECRPS